MDTKREGNLASILQLMVSSYQWFSWLYRCIDNEDVCRVGEVSGVHLCLIHHNHIMVFLAKMTLVSIEISFLFLAQVVLHDVTQCIGVIQCPLPWWWYNNQFPAFVEITTTLASATTCLKRSLFEKTHKNLRFPRRMRSAWYRNRLKFAGHRHNVYNEQFAFKQDTLL